jgi:GNAT superfamily N-acetyltransferase
MTAAAAFTLRPAELKDVAPIVALIRELAEFEGLTDLLQVTPEKLRPHLFGLKPVAEAFVAELPADAVPAGESSVVAFALFFTNFSTFLAQPGLYLEDLYVKPAQRGHGIGEALLTRLGRLALERGYGRFEWTVLDWNANAIRFYERMGATVLPQWRVCRVAGDALQRFAA